jgi:hypothetical protein
MHMQMHEDESVVGRRIHESFSQGDGWNVTGTEKKGSRGSRLEEEATRPRASKGFAAPDVYNRTARPSTIAGTGRGRRPPFAPDWSAPRLQLETVGVRPLDPARKEDTRGRGHRR